MLEKFHSKMVLAFLQGKKMADFDWNDSYSVGIEEMDKQHKKLLRLIESIKWVVTNDRGTDFSIDILRELRAYTLFHFADEEELLLKYEYPGYSSQIAQHNFFIEKLTVYLKEIHDGKITQTLDDIYTFLMDWLLVHIMKQDKNYGEFLNKKGVK